MLRTALATAAVTIAVAATIVAAGSAQTRGRDSTRAAAGAMACNDSRNSDRRASHCEVREDTVSGVNPIDVDAGRNGGIHVRGSDRSDVLVRAMIQTSADTDADARRLAAAVHVETSGGRIRADGPETSRNENWSVSFEISVPRTAMLTLKTNNGGISIDDFHGAAKFHAHNGGITMHNVGGDLRGETTNGGVTVDAADGTHWNGTGLDVETHNGGIRLTLPKGFSAALEAGTVHGRISTDFPITLMGRLGSHIETTIGSGGPKLRAITTNGGITIQQR
jgi:DUF4097 and DUF4098 domain-containing protein YvlB